MPRKSRVERLLPLLLALEALSPTAPPPCRAGEAKARAVIGRGYVNMGWTLRVGTDGIGFERHRYASRYLALAFSPDGRTLAAGSHEGGVTLWDVSACTEKKKWPTFSLSVTSLAFSPDGKALASGGLGDDVKLWEVPRGEKRAEVSCGCPYFSVNAHFA